MTTHKDLRKNRGDFRNRLLLHELSDNQHSVIVGVAAAAEETVDHILRNRNSRGCFHITLCYFNGLYLLIFTCEEGNLFALNGRFLDN